MPTIKEWSTITDNNPYIAPENRMLYLRGKVYNHPNSERFPDGKEIRSSYVKTLDLENKTAITASGNVYTLDIPEEEWIEYLKQNHKEKYEQLIKIYGD
jgi:hypothetical protein